MDRRFISPCPLPSDYERELLTILMEECSEASIRASKLIRFGRDEIQPGQPLSNAQRLAEELGDVVAVMEMAAAAGLLDMTEVHARKAVKRDKLATFLQSRPAPSKGPEHERE